MDEANREESTVSERISKPVFKVLSSSVRHNIGQERLDFILIFSSIEFLKASLKVDWRNQNLGNCLKQPLIIK